jgi:hypothetical protein
MLSNSFKIYRSHLSLFFLTCVIPAVIVAILAYVLDEIPFPALLKLLIGLILGLISGLVSQAGTSIAVSDICLQNQPALAHCLRSIGSRIGGLLVASVVTSIIVLIGSLLFIIPGFVAGVFLMFTAPIIVVERRSWYRAMQRSFQLTRGSFWRNSGILLILFCILFTASIIIGIILGVISVVSSVAIRLLMTPLLSFVTPVLTIAVTLLYYEMRVRKENYDADGLVQDLAA